MVRKAYAPEVIINKLRDAEIHINQGIPIAEVSRKVAIITGYPDSEIMNRAMEHGPITVLRKPFTGDDILNIVHSYT